MDKKRIAVIGSGISGIACAWLLRDQYDVVLYEAASYLGGHTHTVDVELDGKKCPVDTGFLVLNPNTYPNLVALFELIGIECLNTEMSFGVSLNQGSFEWAGSNLDTVFAQRSNLVSPTFYSMLADILRFNREAQSYLARYQHNSLQELLDAEHFGIPFRNRYLLPMAGAIWSSSPNAILDFPAETFVRFCLNHSLLQVNNRPQWRTVAGGARQYVERMARDLADVRLNCTVEAVLRTEDEVLVVNASRTDRFDDVIFATHAPDTLKMLLDASEEEQSILGACRYSANRAFLHTDLALMPRRKKVWSAWNTISGGAVQDDKPVCVTYWLNRLQQLPFSTPLLVTLNPHTEPDPGKVIGVYDYDHPQFDRAAIQAQQQLHAIQGKNRCWFAGAWTGYGFHEDGLKSALGVANGLKVQAPWQH